VRTIQAPPFKLRNVRANANQVIEDELKIHATAEGMLYCCAKPTRKINLAHLDFVSNSTETALHSPVHQCNDTNAAEGMPVYRQNGINSWRRERDSNPRYGFPYSGFQDGWIEGVLSRIKGLEAGWMGAEMGGSALLRQLLFPTLFPTFEELAKRQTSGQVGRFGDLS